jgi:hypothetical protein
MKLGSGKNLRHPKGEEHQEPKERLLRLHPNHLHLDRCLVVVQAWYRLPVLPVCNSLVPRISRHRCLPVQASLLRVKLQKVRV